MTTMEGTTAPDPDRREPQPAATTTGRTSAGLRIAGGAALSAAGLFALYILNEVRGGGGRVLLLEAGADDVSRAAIAAMLAAVLAAAAGVALWLPVTRSTAITGPGKLGAAAIGLALSPCLAFALAVGLFVAAAAVL